MKRFLTATAIIATLCLGSLAQAGVSVSTSSSAPSDHLLTYNSVGYDNFAWSIKWLGNLGSNRQEIAQSFLVSGANDWSIDRITIRVREFGTSVVNQGFHLQVWSMSSASDYTGDSLVNAQLGTFPASGLSPGYWTFGLEHITLSVGNYYAFVVGFESGPASQRFINAVNAYSAYDLYPQGRMFLRQGTPLVWTTTGYASDRDFDFYVQGSPVPEPSCFLVLGSGILALAGMVRRRRNG